MDQNLRRQPAELRTPSDYRHAIDSYNMVVRTGIDPGRSAESLARAADLMREMADASGDYSLYRQAIQTYRKVVTEYAQSSLVAYSLLSIAQINEENLQDLDGAAAAYKEILRYFPNSVMGREAGAVLDRFDDELANRDKTPDVQLTPSTSNGELTDLPRLNNVRNFNGPDYARVVLDLSQGTRYADRRIENSRVGIFISGGAVDSSLQGRRFITRGSGLLKRITVSDAGPGSDGKGKAHSYVGQRGVSIEIETSGLYGYSTFRLSNPERIIIDLHSAKYAAEARATWRPAAGESAAPPQPDSTPSRSAETGHGVGAPGIGAPRPDSDRSRVAGSTGTSPISIPDSAKITASGADGHKTALDSPSQVEVQSAVRGPRDEKSAGSARCIVIDPGHGGHDTGTIGSGGLREKDLVLDVARRLRDYISKSYPEIEVILTRESDRFIALEERTAIANSRRADLFISIHANSSPSRIASGVETFIQDPNRKPKYETPPAPARGAEVASLVTAPGSNPIGDRAKTAAASASGDAKAPAADKPEPMVASVSAGNRFGASRELAGFIQAGLVRGIGATSPRTAADRGVKHAAFAVLLGAAMPSVLAEVSFVSNRRDENLLQTGAFRDRIAGSLFSGLSAYLKKNRPSPAAAKK
jgi:N-acetylmuramoyl-L-alanine amidase